MDLNEDEMRLKRIGFIVSDYKPELLHGEPVTRRRGYRKGGGRGGRNGAATTNNATASFVLKAK